MDTLTTVSKETIQTLKRIQNILNLCNTNIQQYNHRADIDMILTVLSSSMTALINMEYIQNHDKEALHVYFDMANQNINVSNDYLSARKRSNKHKTASDMTSHTCAMQYKQRLAICHDVLDTFSLVRIHSNLEMYRAILHAIHKNMVNTPDKFPTFITHSYQFITACIHLKKSKTISQQQNALQQLYDEMFYLVDLNHQLLEKA